MIPHQVTAIPLYIGMWQLGILNTYAAIILPSTISVFGIFLLRQFFSTVPDDLIHAARLDGLGEFAIVWRIMLPTAMPALVAFGLLSFVWNWNEFFWPLIVVQSEQLATPPLGDLVLQQRRSRHQLRPADGRRGRRSMRRSIVAFLLAQRRFIDGVTMTGGEVTRPRDKRRHSMHKITRRSALLRGSAAPAGAVALPRLRTRAVDRPSSFNVQYSIPVLFKELMENIGQTFMANNPGIKVNFRAPENGYEEIMQRNLRDAVTNYASRRGLPRPQSPAHAYWSATFPSILTPLHGAGSAKPGAWTSRRLAAVAWPGRRQADRHRLRPVDADPLLQRSHW